MRTERITELVHQVKSVAKTILEGAGVSKIEPTLPFLDRYGNVSSAIPIPMYRDNSETDKLALHESLARFAKTNPDVEFSPSGHRLFRGSVSDQHRSQELADEYSLLVTNAQALGFSSAEITQAINYGRSGMRVNAQDAVLRNQQDIVKKI